MAATPQVDDAPAEAEDPAFSWTSQELERLPDDGNRYEVLDGQLLVTPAPARRHQRVTFAIARQLYDWADRHGAEVLPAPVDVVFDERTTLEPDVVVYTADRTPPPEQTKYSTPPDLAVEVVSPTTRQRDLMGKREAYERFGVPTYWVVDPDQDRALVWRFATSTDPEVVEADGGVLRAPDLPGLAVPLADVLA